MKILGQFYIKKRGPVFTARVTTPVHHEGARLRRLSDGASWPIRGVDRFCKFVGQPKLNDGEDVGFLMPDGCDLSVGDEVAVVPQGGDGDG